MQRLDAYFFVFYAEVVDGKYRIVSNDRLKQHEEEKIERQYRALLRGKHDHRSYMRLLKEGLMPKSREATRTSKKGENTGSPW